MLYFDVICVIWGQWHRLNEVFQPNSPHFTNWMYICMQLKIQYKYILCPSPSLDIGHKEWEIRDTRYNIIRNEGTQDLSSILAISGAIKCNISWLQKWVRTILEIFAPDTEATNLWQFLAPEIALVWLFMVPEMNIQY